MPYPQIHRLVVVGDDKVGKTALIEQLIFGNHVKGQTTPTLADIYDIVLETEKGTHERLQIFDTAGSLFTQPENTSDQEHYLIIADGFILVYDVTSKLSFDLVRAVRQRIVSRNKEVPMVVVGNKLDCVRAVERETATAWARSQGIRLYEVTVMNRDSLKEPFCYVAWRMANPGRGFSALPLLASAASSRTHSPLHEGTNSPPAGKLDESQVDGSSLSSPSHELEPCPEDALFPSKRSGPAALFPLGDCLTSHTKPKSDQSHHSAAASNH